ncbi:MAG: hypothetical protein U0V70_04600 [Terriglobia bacterium]
MTSSFLAELLITGGRNMVTIPEYFKPVFEHTKESLIDLLNNPYLWSDPMITKTLERVGGKPFDIEDARLLIKDYLAVLAERIRKETF